MLLSKSLMIVKQIKNVIFDQVCLICSGKDLSNEFSFVCKDCLNAFLQPDEIESSQDKVCNICKHPLLEDDKCPSCSLIKPIYYDNYFFYHRYSEFFKHVVNVWKKHEYFNIIRLFEKIIHSDPRIDKKTPITIIPDNVLGKMKKGRAGFHNILSKLKKRGYNTIAPPYKRRIITIKHQKNKSQIQRIENISKSYYIPQENVAQYSGEVYLLDDIYTSGSTLNLGAKLLKQAGFNKVTIISIFRAIILKK